MSYRKIAVLAETESAASALAQAASKIGAGLHALVVGIHPAPGYTPDAQVIPYFTNDQLLQLQQQSAHLAESAKAEFSRIMSQSDCVWEWSECRVESYRDIHPFRDQALSCDLVLVATSTNGNTFNWLHGLLVETGTPVLAVPHGAPLAASLDSLGSRILVAWNGSMESARAVKDAMPLLVNAENVQVLIVGDEGGTAVTGEAPKALEQYLRQHRVQATYRGLPEERYRTGHQLLDYAEQHDRDLLVMGGYVHSRVYRALMGATTSQVLQYTSIPVFLSH